MAVTERTVWTLWHQGYERAPPVVAACLESWRRLNPGWRIVALDRHSLADWIDLRAVVDVDRPDLTLQKLSAIARLCLLRRYGGVWADATVACFRPLDAWLPQVYGSGFFTFRNPGPDRLASNWLIAAEADNPLLVALHDAFIGLWNATTFTNQNNRFGRWAVAKLSPTLNRDARRTLWWTTPLVRHTVRAYPYFIFHYTFNRLILTRPDLRRLWESAEGLDAGLPHRVQALAGTADGRERLAEEVAQDGWTVQKLDWRVDAEDPYWSDVVATVTGSPREVRAVGS